MANKKEILDILEDKGSAVYDALYEFNYPDGQGPSQSSYCEGREMDKEDKEAGITCGCWVHHLIRMIEDDG